MRVAVRDHDIREVSGVANETTGRSSPLGATVLPEGMNFSLFSRRASGVELLFFDREDDPRPARVIPIDPAANRTYHYWHVFVPGVQAGQLYAYRVQGPSDKARGLRFDPAKVLLDPTTSSDQRRKPGMASSWANRTGAIPHTVWRSVARSPTKSCCCT
jgi:pullulanase/glycogen debranching enzyme